ncbi:BolA family protein [Hansschlegelia beijingensis]|uniref:BolA protein n=1 Tax=Hansschlegelia beijingensis TaxID=1133344 RepID=A0A7W6GGL8_9HYPH|nr:BolA family protein [Hansschlegelia beijingensis]MBB3972889.1 BolA protein [Hansschlegelia beijingensis]
MSVRDRIESTLREALSPQRLEVVDESHLHAGHAGSRPGGETHFRVRVVSDAFSGVSRINRHRRVNALLAGELAGQVHALAIDARSPDEPGRP